MLLQEILDEFLLDCRIRNLSKRTIKTYDYQISIFVNYMELEFDEPNLLKIKKAHIKKYVLDLQETKKATYINQLIKTLKLFFKYIVKEEYLEKNLVEDISYIKTERALLNTFNDIEVSSMINYYGKNKDFISQRNKVIIEIFADCGLRAQEVRELKNENMFDTYIKFFGKGRKERIVPISPYLSYSLKKYKRTKKGYFNNLRRYRKIDDYLIVTKSGQQLKNNVLLEKIVNEASAHVGVCDEVQRKSCHSLRHYYAQKLLKSGVNLYTISRLLGHSNIKTTQTYLNSLTNEEILIDVKGITPLTRLIEENKL
ncbi:tyrosine-type recombinase/integrase [Enterococcus casseliflavus]|uniref:tyrosine-type recombinase/integrase n=1 Tax=Enterococcus casseliflavus TaxID=37734 RepID=UPI002DB86F81|nr:tyrosine-type recombinase/integrase [Enterococcus casseliflavus]MEB6147647.1 tyrosine-type recombinase/integrase [Enterococcus casseliflavus]